MPPKNWETPLPQKAPEADCTHDWTYFVLGAHVNRRCPKCDRLEILDEVTLR